MRRVIPSIVRITCVLSCAMAASASIASAQGGSSPKDVVVANTAAQPVPVTGLVAISGTPTVTIGNTVSVTLPGVINVKLPDAPFQAYVQCRPSGSYWYGCDAYSVPAGVRLLIEQVGMRFVPNDPTTEIAGVRIQTIADASSGEHWIDPPQARTFRDTFKIQGGSQLTKIYADPNTTIYFSAFVNKGSTPLNEQFFLITLSGQRISQP